MLIILTGSSGVGKNTVIDAIEQSSDKYRLMPTYTTRQKRDYEKEGYPFFFITKDEFQEKIKSGELIEHEFIHTNYYGSSYKIFQDLLDEDIVLVKDIGIEGAQNIAIKLSKITPVIKIFLTTKNKKELKKRLKGRGEKQIKLRLKRFKKEQKEKNKFDYIILNNNLENTVKLVKTIHEIDYDEFLTTVPVSKIKLKKIQKYSTMLLKGKILKPITINVWEDKAYIVNGHEKFIASLLTNKPVCKELVLNEPSFNLSQEQIMEWKHLVRESINNN